MIKSADGAAALCVCVYVNHQTAIRGSWQQTAQTQARVTRPPLEEKITAQRWYVSDPSCSADCERVTIAKTLKDATVEMLLSGIRGTA